MTYPSEILGGSIKGVSLPPAKYSKFRPSVRKKSYNFVCSSIQFTTEKLKMQMLFFQPKIRNPNKSEVGGVGREKTHTQNAVIFTTVECMFRT